MNYSFFCRCFVSLLGIQTRGSAALLLLLLIKAKEGTVVRIEQCSSAQAGSSGLLK